MQRTKRQMLIGGIVAVLGWLAIFAMMLELLPQHIALYMIAYAITLGGFMVGLLGAAYHIRDNIIKHRRENGDEYDK